MSPLRNRKFARLAYKLVDTMRNIVRPWKKTDAYSIKADIWRTVVLLRGKRIFQITSLPLNFSCFDKCILIIHLITLIVVRWGLVVEGSDEPRQESELSLTYGRVEGESCLVAGLPGPKKGVGLAWTGLTVRQHRQVISIGYQGHKGLNLSGTDFQIS